MTPFQNVPIISDMKNRYKRCFAVALSLTLLVSCGTKPINNLACQRTEITSAPLTDFAVNVYLDGTPSMEGYVSQGNSRYVRSLEELFNMLEQTAPLTLDDQPSNKPAVNYLRLGENSSTNELAQPLEGGNHRRAIKREFYNGSGFPALDVTQIDAAIKEAQPENLTVIVTDLYQKDQYANQVVSDISAQLENTPQGAVGVIGIRSEFNGTVYTEALRGESSFSFSSAEPAHPFYVLLLGRVDEVAFYMETLKQRLDGVGFQNGVELVLFSPERLHKSVPALARQGREAFPASERSAIQVPGYNMSYGQKVKVNLKDNAVQPLKLKEEVTLPFANSGINAIPYTFPQGNLGVSITPSHQSFDYSNKQYAPKEDPSLDQALTVADANLTPEGLNFSLNIDPDAIRTPGIYFYTLDATVQPTSATSNELNEIWATWSSDASDSATNTDGSRTHNLDDLLEGLADMTLLKMRQEAIPLGQYCYLIQPS